MELWCYFRRLMASSMLDLQRDHSRISLIAFSLLMNGRSKKTCSAFSGTSYCLKNHEEFSEGVNYSLTNYHVLQIITRKFVRTRIIGVTKTQTNFLEILFQAIFHQKGNKSQEFCRNLFALLLHNIVGCS